MGWAGSTATAAGSMNKRRRGWENSLLSSAWSTPKGTGGASTGSCRFRSCVATDVLRKLVGVRVHKGLGQGGGSAYLLAEELKVALQLHQLLRATAYSRTGACGG